MKYEDGRSGYLTYSPLSPFNVIVENKDGQTENTDITSSFFKTLLDCILSFFLSGDLPFEKEQTLEVISIRDALIDGENKFDEWIKIK